MAGTWLFPKEPEKPADLIVTNQNRKNRHQSIKDYQL